MKRYEELDSVRGLASVSVVLSHSLTMTALFSVGTFSGDIFNKFVLNSPLKVLFSSHQAVVLFFILSGFVLSLPYINGRNQSYFFFLTRRVCRIYVPYLFAFLFGLCMRELFANGSLYGLWGGQIDLGIILSHVFLVGMFSQDYFNPVIWSLVHEMRISLIFPFLMILIMRLNWKNSLILGVLASLIGTSLHFVISDVDPRTNYFDSLHYILMFMCGALLAKYKTYWIDFYKKQSTLKRLFIICTGFFLYTYSISVSTRLLKDPLLERHLSDWVTTAGGLVLIIVGISEQSISKLLCKNPILFIGKISFSVYLCHLVVFLTVVSIIGDKVSNISLWLISMALSFTIATILYYMIEIPSMKLGKRLTTRTVKTTEVTQKTPAI